MFFLFLFDFHSFLCLYVSELSFIILVTSGSFFLLQILVVHAISIYRPEHRDVYYIVSTSSSRQKCCQVCCMDMSLRIIGQSFFCMNAWFIIIIIIFIFNINIITVSSCCLPYLCCGKCWEDFFFTCGACWFLYLILL